MLLRPRCRRASRCCRCRALRTPSASGSRKTSAMRSTLGAPVALNLRSVSRTSVQWGPHGRWLLRSVETPTRTAEACWRAGGDGLRMARPSCCYARRSRSLLRSALPSSSAVHAPGGDPAASVICFTRAASAQARSLVRCGHCRSWQRGDRRTRTGSSSARTASQPRVASTTPSARQVPSLRAIALVIAKLSSSQSHRQRPADSSVKAHH